MSVASRSVILTSFFFFNDTATTEIYTLSLHDALPISRFVKSAAPDPQQNQALRPSFPRAPGGEVSRDPIDGRSTVRPQQQQAADQSDLHGRWPFCTRSRSQGLLGSAGQQAAVSGVPARPPH